MMVRRSQSSFLTTIILLINLFGPSQQAPLEAHPNVQTTTDADPHCHPWIFVQPPTLSPRERLDITDTIFNERILNQNFAVAGLPAFTVFVSSEGIPREDGMRGPNREVTLYFENPYSQGYNVILERFPRFVRQAHDTPNAVAEIAVAAALREPYYEVVHGRRLLCYNLEDAGLYRWVLQLQPRL